MKQPSRRKRVPKAGKRVRGSPCSHLLESHKNINLYNYKIYAEDLSRTSTDSLIVTSVSVSPCEL